MVHARGQSCRLQRPVTNYEGSERTGGCSESWNLTCRSQTRKREDEPELLVQFGNIALNEALKEKPAETRNIFNSAYGIGSQFGVLLPYSREHELEADKLGLIFMAMAGYDPNTAIPFWERMAAMGGNKPPEFLSTHPSDETRIKKIKAALPEAMKYYRKRWEKIPANVSEAAIEIIGAVTL